MLGCHFGCLLCDVEAMGDERVLKMFDVRLEL